MYSFGCMTPTFEYRMRIPEVLLAPLSRKLSEFPGRARRREKYLYVLHLVARQLRMVRHDVIMSGGKVHVSTWHCNLQATILRAAIGNDYRSVVEDLVDWGLIGRSFSYMPGTAKVRGYSKAYWFMGDYAIYWERYCYTRDRVRSDITGEARKFGRLRTIQVKSRPFLRRLERCAEEVKEKQLLDPRVGGCHDSLSHFSIDRKRASGILDDMVSRGEVTESCARRELRKVDRFNMAGRSRTALFVKKDRFGRIHTNITQLKKEVRYRCLYCDGKPTAGVDIKSSQGAFLGAILRSLADPLGVLDLNSSATLAELRRNADVVGRPGYLDECDRYDALLREGRLYEFFSEELSSDFDLGRTVGREEAKHMFFVMLFGPLFTEGEDDGDRAAVRRVWAEHFPSLLLAIERMKAGNYAALAREMQRIESNFVFDRVVPRVVEELRCPYCTVHDSIIVEASLADSVRAIVEDELRKVGVPTMTSEEFGMTWKTEDEVMFERDVETEMLGTYTAASIA